MSGTLSALCMTFLVAHVLAEVCVVNERLPLFGVAVKRKPSQDVKRGAAPASLLPGGACHMTRLTRVRDTTGDDPRPGASYSAQMCSRNASFVTCAMLAQDSASPASSRQHLHHFEATTPGGARTDKGKRHARRLPCSACHRKKLSRVLTRLLGTTPLRSTARQQLSVGEPLRISTARLVSAQLHRDICGSNTSCPQLARAVNANCEQGDCLRRGALLPALLGKMSVPPKERDASTDLLWSRNWVFCPHTSNVSTESPSEAVDTISGCRGSVPKSAWLNHLTRGRACAAAIGDNIQEGTSSINFCLLNDETQNLCSRMEDWQQRTEKYLCEASGACPQTDFFYTPTTFNLQEQEFVYSTVLRFYQTDAGRSCPTAQTRPDAQRLQALANQASLQQCASVSIEPLLVVVQQLRTAKNMLVLAGYHALRVGFRLLELFVAVADAADAAAARLLREVVAFMQVIGDFIEHLASSITELALSRGVGSWFKELIYALCKIVEWIYNNIWTKVACPVVKFVLDLAHIIVGVWLTIIDVLKKLFLPVDVLEGYVKFIQEVLIRIGSALAQCEEKNFECSVDTEQVPDGDAAGTLPMPTRCWSTYVSFFGDNQQLSCTRADTCKADALSSERVVCGSCPALENPSVRDFACDYTTRICTCGVPQLTATSCLVNEDCMHRESEASCLLINNDLQTSRSSVACDQCQSQRMCFHNSLGDVGVCACGAQQRNFQLCSPEEASRQSTLSLMLDGLCLYTPTARAALSFEVEFAQTSVIACQELVPMTAGCAYVVDKNVYVVRGYRSSRRRLLSDEAPRAVNYSSTDPACLDALVSDALPNTRASCQALFDSSSATLTLLGLDRQLPLCALCSFHDAMDATRRNPLAVLRLVTNPGMISVVLRRHGPGSRFLQLFGLLHSGMHTAAARIAAASADGLVEVERGPGAIVVRVDDSVLPAPVARALEAWITEAIRHDEARAGSAGAAGNASATSNASAAGNASAAPPSRRLLLFQELVLAVEERVRDGWDQADRLHEAFAQGVSQILTYRHFAEAGVHEQDLWFSAPGNSCNELQELLRIASRVANGIMQGWLTLTHRRDELQSMPADSLAKAWPRIQRPVGEDAVPEHLLEPPEHSDLLIQLSADAVNATLGAADVRPSVFYDLFYSVVMAANASFTCPYEAVQTCSHWRVRLWHGFVIVSLYFSIVALLAGTVGFSFVMAFVLSSLFSIALLQLCYGYMWTCAPMIPVCAWQDLTESVNALLPLSIDIPDELKKTSPQCRGCKNPSLPCPKPLLRYPEPDCLKSCRDSPFAYTSASSVVEWALAETWFIDPWAAKFALDNSHRVPLFDHAQFNKKLKSNIVALHRASPGFIRAQRLCAGLSTYLLIPYMMLILFAISFLTVLVPLITAQIYPCIMLVTSLLTAASVDDEDPEDDSD
jgi:hypothetical protein